MSNVCDYVKWRGDLKLEQSEFNEIDGLILSRFSYFPFDNIIKENEIVTIKELSERFKKQDVSKLPILWKDDVDLFPLMGESKRYGEMLATKYINKIDVEQEKQFSAITVLMPDDTIFVSYRGTDNTIVGWKEDFNMSYMMPVPSQQSAVEYVNLTAKGFLKKYWLAGHSKGGNLALYSGVYCNKKVQKKIVRINSFDGPGFNRKVVNEPEYLAVKDKISAYVPVSSIVGMLLEHEESYKVVDSSERSIMQHEGLSWQIDRDQFVLKDKVDEFSSNFSQVLKAWLSKMDNEEKKIFIDTFFDILEKAGIHELEEIFNLDMRTVGSMVKNLVNLPPEIREAVIKLLKMLMEEGRKNKKQPAKGGKQDE